MKQNNRGNKKQVSNNSMNNDRRGDTDRTSNQGRKTASGGRANTNNRGHQKDRTGI
jgi:hypothetical protein